MKNERLTKDLESHSRTLSAGEFLRKEIPYDTLLIFRAVLGMKGVCYGDIARCINRCKALAYNSAIVRRSG